MKPEAAFTMAAKQLGDRQRVAGEFAKINPQRIWLERAIWMAAGILLMAVLDRLARVPSSVILNYGFTRGLDPVAWHVASNVCCLAGLAVLAGLLWCGHVRRPDWAGGGIRFCERRPFWAGVVLMSTLWGSQRLCMYWPLILAWLSPQLHSWLLPMTHAPNLSNVEVHSIYLWSRFAGDTIWAVVLCVLVVRIGRGRFFLQRTAVAQGGLTNSQRLEGLLWMVAGCVLASFGFADLHSCLVLLPVHWALPVIGSSPLLHHLVGFAMAAMHLALWAMPFWACWLFSVRYPWIGDRIRRAFKYRPIWTSVGLTLLVNSSSILVLVYHWAGLHMKTPARGLGPIILEWNFGYWSGFCQQAALAVLFVSLVCWRMKSPKAGWRCRGDEVAKARFTTP